MTQSTLEKKVIPWLGTLWFFVCIDSFFLWWDFGGVIRVGSWLGIFYASIMLYKKFRATSYNLPILLSLLIYIPWLLSFVGNPNVLINKLFNFIPLLLLLFWPKAALGNWYLILRKVIVFFAIGSSVVSILSVIGVLSYLPHFTFEGASDLHRSKGIGYYVYGVFVTTYTSGFGISGRACGPVQEPGHWAVFLGLFYLIDWYVLRKRNIWFVIGGFFTFSSAFWVMFLSVEIFNLFSISTFRKTVPYLAAFFIASAITFVVLPQHVKDSFTYLFFERNLESVYEGFDGTGSLDAALDARAGNYSLIRYYDLKADDYLFGTGFRDTTSALSDYRGTILYMGLIGLLLSIIPSVLIIRKAKLKLALSLAICLFLVYLHRGWMYYTSYIYLLAFWAVSLSSEPKTDSCAEIGLRIERNNSDNAI